MHFGDLLKKYMQEKRRTDQQLADLSGVPKFTIVSWREGRTKRPRHVEDLLSLAEALTLSQHEADGLLESAGHQTITQQFESAQRKKDGPALEKLAYWADQSTPSPKKQPKQNTVFQAPAAVINFTGREVLIDQVKSYLLQPESWVASLVGMGGVGKTAIANQLAYQLRDHFPDGVFWVDLRHMVDREEADIERAIAAFLSAIIRNFASGFGKDAELSLLSAQLRDIMANNRLLLIVDNIESADHLTHFLPPSDGESKLLITTRRKLMSLADAQDFEVSSLSEEEAVSLFEKYVAKRRLVLEPERTKTLCNFLGYLPLAIQIVASDLAETEDITLQEYLDLLVDEKERLVEDLDHASLSVRATFELSYKRLSADLRPLFANLIIFRGLDFSTEAVIKTFGMSPIKVKKLLGYLYRISLLEKGRPSLDIGGSRYQFHPLLKQFAQEKLVQFSTLTPAFYDNAAGYFINLAFENRYDRYDVLDYEWENCLEAILWTLQRKDLDQTLKGITGLTALRLGLIGFLDSRVLWREGINILSDTLTGFDANIPLQQQALLHIKLGNLLYRVGKIEDSLTHLEKGLSLAKDGDIENSELKNYILMYGADCIARIKLEQSDLEEVMAWSEQAKEAFSPTIEQADLRAEAGYSMIRHAEMLGRLKLFDQGLALAEQGFSLLPQEPNGATLVAYNVLGSLNYHNSLQDRAYTFWEQGLEMAKKLNDLRRIINFNFNIALIASDSGDFKTAIPLQLDTIEALHKMGNLRAKVVCMSNIAEDLIFSGRFEDADKTLQDALKHAEELGLNDVRASILVNLFQLELARLDIEKATLYLEKIKTLQGSLSFESNLVEVQYLTARYHFLKNQLGEGIELLTTLLSNDSLPSLQKCRCLHLLGEMQLSAGESAEGEATLKNGLSISNEQNYRHAMAEAEFALGKHFASTHRLDEAASYLTNAKTYFATQEIVGRLNEVNRVLNESV